MSAPENPTPNPENRPLGMTGARPVSGSTISGPASTPPESTVRIPTASPAPATPKPEPAATPGPLASGVSEPSSSIGKPQLRTPEIKLSTPPAPPATKSASLPAPRKTGSVWLVRVGLFAGIGLALALLYWSVFVRLLPMSKEHNAKAREMTRASDELELLRRRWSAGDIEEIKSRYARAQETLFDLKSEPNEWQTQIEDQARIGTLDAKVKMGIPEPARPPVDGITAMTAEVTLQPNTVPGATLTPYARLLKFTETLAASPKRLDLMELSVTGDSNSVSQAQAVVQLLVGEKKL